MSEEKTEINPPDEIGYCRSHTFTAFAGTGFNMDNPQHVLGSDALRYAIEIQMLRDQGKFTEADARRDEVSGSFMVQFGKNFTRLKWRDE